jgi:hypothetical protein
MKATVYRTNETYPNYVYDVDDVRYVACMDCLPNYEWWQGMKDAGRLVSQELTTVPCQFCGGYADIDS